MAGLPDRVAALQRQNAFLMAAAGHINSLEAAWRLADCDTLVITEGAGADVTVAAVLERYPYLALGDEPFGDSGGFLQIGPQPSGRPANGKAVSGTGSDSAVLQRGFPCSTAAEVGASTNASTRSTTTSDPTNVERLTRLRMLAANGIITKAELEALHRVLYDDAR